MGCNDCNRFQRCYKVRISLLYIRLIPLTGNRKNLFKILKSCSCTPGISKSMFLCLQEVIYFYNHIGIENLLIHAPISVRVSNELGAGNAWLAKFSVLVVSITSVGIGVVCMIVVFATKDYFPYLFTNSNAVAEETTELSLLLGFTVLLNSLQPVLSGKYKM